MRWKELLLVGDHSGLGKVTVRTEREVAPAKR
jgi:hypothetical protein